MSPQQHQFAAEALAADLYSGAKAILLTDDGSLGDRLWHAYADMAVHAAPLAAQMPASLKDRILALHGTLTGGAGVSKVPDADTVRATVDGFSREAQVRGAVAIADLADDLDRVVRLTHAATVNSTHTGGVDQAERH